MLYFTAKKNLEKDIPEIFSEYPETQDFKVEFKKVRCLEHKASINFAKKTVTFNTANFYLYSRESFAKSLNDFQGFYYHKRDYLDTIKPVIFQHDCDKLIIEAFYDRSRIAFMLNPEKYAPENELERIALEVISYDKYDTFMAGSKTDSLIETLSYRNAIQQTKDFFIERGATEEEAEKRIVKALNDDLKDGHLRNKPIYPYHEYPFENFKEILETTEKSVTKARECTFENPLLIKNWHLSLTASKERLWSDSTKEEERYLSNFYHSFSPERRLYLSNTVEEVLIHKEVIDDVKEIKHLDNPRVTELGVIKKDTLNRSFFADFSNYKYHQRYDNRDTEEFSQKLKESLVKQKDNEKSKISEKEPDRGLF